MKRVREIAIPEDRSPLFEYYEILPEKTDKKVPAKSPAMMTGWYMGKPFRWVVLNSTMRPLTVTIERNVNAGTLEKMLKSKVTLDRVTFADPETQWKINCVVSSWTDCEVTITILKSERL